MNPSYLSFFVDVNVHEIKLFALGDGMLPSDEVRKELSIMYKEIAPSFDPLPGTYHEFSLEVATICDGSDTTTRIYYTIDETKAPDRTSRSVRCGESIIFSTTGIIYFRAYAVSEGKFQSDVYMGTYILLKPPYDSFPVGSIDFDVLPKVQVHVVEKTLPSSNSYRCSNRNIRGRLVVLENPVGHFDFMEPAGKCGKITKPSVTGKGYKNIYDQYSSKVMQRYGGAETYVGLFQNNATLHYHMHKQFEKVSQNGCIVVTNAGFFNTTNNECLGDLVSEGTILQTSDRHNVNFGIRDGNFVTGYVTADDIRSKKNKPFDTLVSGIVWLVRKGEIYVDESLSHNVDGDNEDLSAQSTGAQFSTVKSARTAIGHDKQGRLMILQIEGETWVRGMSLYEFAEFAVELGMYSGINIDGGGSASMTEQGVLVSEPSWMCQNVDHFDPNHDTDPFLRHSYCEKEVSSITCIHALAPPPFVSDISQEDDHSRQNENEKDSEVPDNIDNSHEQSNDKASHVRSSEEETNSTSVALVLGLLCLLILSVIHNCRQFSVIKKMRRSERQVEMASSVSARGARGAVINEKQKSVASPLHGSSKGSVTYTKVATEVDSDGDSDDETIEFNDLDMTVKEFNPFTFGGGANKA